MNRPSNLREQGQRWRLVPRCQTCGDLMHNPYEVVYLLVREHKNDPIGRQIAVCGECASSHFPTPAGRLR